MQTNNLTVTAIIQARMGSVRLPGKSLTLIEQKPLLYHVIQRVQQSKAIDQIIVATTTTKAADQIYDFTKQQNICCYRGSEQDVLDRFYQCAQQNKCQIIVRITADDPFKDPEIIDTAIAIFKQHTPGIDYVSNTLFATYPLGLDIEVFSFDALKKAWLEATDPDDREHVTPYMWKNKSLFRTKNFENVENLSHHRWTIDTPQDLLFTKKIYKTLYSKKKIFLMHDILNLLRINPSFKNRQDKL